MHHAVTHGVNLLQVLDATIFRIYKGIENGLDGTLVVGKTQVDVLLAAVIKLELDEAVRQTDFFYTALSEGLVLFNLDEFVLGRAAATVKH